MPANPQVTDEMVEKAARAMEPSPFYTFDQGYTQRNAFETRAFLNAEKTVRRVRRKARIALEAALADHVVGWRDIESAPDNNSVLLGWFDWRDGQWCTEVGAATTGQRFENGYSNVSKHGSATHWTPLPAAPLPQKEG